MEMIKLGSEAPQWLLDLIEDGVVIPVDETGNEFEISHPGGIIRAKIGDYVAMGGDGWVRAFRRVK